MLNPTKVLALGAHTDDVELGCGATLSRLHRGGAEVRVVAFSRAELSLPADAAPETLENEFRDAMSILGLPPTHARCLRIPVRHFNEHRQRILDAMITIRREFEPDLILTHASTDTHQDHSIIHAESVRAFRNRVLLGYHAPWNERRMNLETFIEVEESDLIRKVQMLDKYRSQHQLARGYFNASVTRSIVSFYGLQAGVGLAEGFEPISIVLRMPT